MIVSTPASRVSAATASLLLALALGAPACVLADTPIPYKTSDLDVGGTVSRIVLLLGLLCAGGAVAAVFLRKRLVQSGTVPEKTGAHIRVTDRRTLSRKAMVHLLEVDGREVLVLESEHGVAITELARRPDAPLSRSTAVAAEQGL